MERFIFKFIYCFKNINACNFFRCENGFKNGISSAIYTLFQMRIMPVYSRFIRAFRVSRVALIKHTCESKSNNGKSPIDILNFSSIYPDIREIWQP